MRRGKEPPHLSWLVVPRRGTALQMIGRDLDHDVLDASATWDDAKAHESEPGIGTIIGSDPGVGR